MPFLHLHRWQSKLFLLLLFAASLVIILCSKAPVTPSAPVPLRDIRGHWAQGCIKTLVQRDILTAYPDNTFRPDASVSRAEFAVLVRRALPDLKPIRSTTQFRDVPANHWATAAIQYTYQTGVLSGSGAGAFNPTGKITRVQALGALAGGLRYSSTQPVSQSLKAAFTDAGEIPAYAQGAIAAALENRLVVNYPNVKRLNPNQPTNRAEVAAFFCQALSDTAALVPLRYLAASGTQTGFSGKPVGIGKSEIRGVWLTNVDSDVLFDRGSLNQAVDELARLRFNTLYPTVWNWGYTLYPSQVAKQVMGVTVDPRPEAIGLQNRDMLAEFVQQGHQHGIAVIPWFEFGFMAPADSELARLHPDWLTKRQDGSEVWMEGKWPRVWLNPFKPEVQQFILDLILEIVTRYDIDGIQLDDHYGLVSEFGYDDFTVQLYQKEHNGQLPPADVKDPEWLRWRADKITEFTTRLFRAIKAKKEILVTLSPNNYEFSYHHSLQDWRTWQQQGLIEELVLQVYRNNLDSFVAELNAPEIQAARQKIPVGVGILTGLKDRTVPIKQVQEQVQAVRDRGLPGVSFFFYETLWNLTTEPLADRKTAFQKMFAPAATRPNVLKGWKPA